MFKLGQRVFAYTNGIRVSGEIKEIITKGENKLYIVNLLDDSQVILDSESLEESI